MSDRDDGAFDVLCYAPPPPDPPGVEVHGGLKLDWHSGVGRAGMLLEWRPVGRGVDAGVPVPVARALAAGLCAATTVVGCTLDLPEEATAGWTPVPGGHAYRYPGRRWLGVGPHPLGLLASRTVDVVSLFLEDDAFAWSLESQVLLLAPPGELPRLDQLDRAVVEGCFAIPISATVAQLARAGVIGLVRAGVDGDVAGLYVLNAAWREPVLVALASATSAAGGRWEERDGAAYWPAPAARTASGGR